MARFSAVTSKPRNSLASGLKNTNRRSDANLKGLHNMNKKTDNLKNTGNGIGVGTAIGVAVFAITNEPTWIAVGVAVGAAFGFNKLKK